MRYPLACALLPSLLCLLPISLPALGSGFDGAGMDMKPQMDGAQALSKQVVAEAKARKDAKDAGTPPSTGDPVLDGLRARFAAAPAYDPADSGQRRKLVGILTKKTWTCKRYRDGAWQDDEGGYRYETVLFHSDEIREYDVPIRPDRKYLGYRLTPQGAAAMYGFLWLRVLDDNTLLKEFSDTSKPPGDRPSLIVPTQALRWYTLCTGSDSN